MGSPPSEPPRWRSIKHALVSDLLAVKLLLELAGMARGEEERLRHLDAARRALAESDRLLQALRQAVQLMKGARDIATARQALTENDDRMQALRKALQGLDKRAQEPKRPKSLKPRTRKSGKNPRKAGRPELSSRSRRV